ncbi:MAG: hypothetical protein ABIM03_03535 [candidate division WOR-3 bacterium]
MNLFLLKLKYLKFFLKEREYKKFLVPSLISILFLFGFIKILTKIFSILKNIGVLGEIIGIKILDLVLFSLFFFLILSNAVTAFGTFLKDKEIEFLLRFPLKRNKIYLLKFTETIIYSSWAPCLLILPLLYSYFKVFSISFIKIFLIILSLPFYLLIPSFLGILFLIIILKLFPKITREGIMLMLTSFFILYLFLYMRMFRPEIFKIFKEIEDIRILAVYLQKLGGISPYFLPSRWIINFLNYDGIYLILNLLLFPVSFILLFPVFNLVEHIQIGEEGKRIYKKEFKIKAPIFYSKVLQIWIKEMKSIIRDFSQFSQAIFLLVLVLFYVLSIRRTPIYFTHPLWHIFIGIGNFIFLGYLFATLSIRFLFPTYSLEGKGLKFLKISPVKSSFYISSKTLVWLLIFVILTYFTYNFTINSLNLKIPNIFKKYFNLVLLIESISVSVISISIGIIYPSLNETNPSKIASSTGAFFAAVITILYVFLMDSIIANPVYIYAKTGNIYNMFLNFLITLFISILLIIIFFLSGIKFYNKREM